MVKVDKDLCIGCGACEATCPDGFELKDGKSNVKDPNAPCIDNAIKDCPVQAISK